MGGADDGVVVDLIWSEPPSLRVESTETGLRVIAHPGLSEAQVREACSRLDGDGERVLRAWQLAVGRS